MQTYRYELHCHTKQGSACALNTGSEVACRFKERGYAGIVITDHLVRGSRAIVGCLSWREWVERFFIGYEEAKATGDRIGLQVFCGWEYFNLASEFLTFGLDKQWLLENDDVFTMSVEEYCDRVHRDGGYIIHAHPFRIRPSIRLFPEHVDAVETVNVSHYKYPFYDKRANFYAESYGLTKVVGSDYHEDRAGGLCAIEFEEKAKDAKHLATLLAEGKHKNYRLDLQGNIISYIE